MSYDSEGRKVIIVGGQTLKGQLLNDCWSLSEVPVMVAETGSNATRPQFADFEYQGKYEWTTCDPTSALALKPQARYGHQSVYFHNSLYVVGGFAQDGLRVQAKHDIWILEFGHNESTWNELMPSTKTPDPRGFHALWLSGFKIFLHGGQVHRVYVYEDGGG